MGERNVTPSIKNSLGRDQYPVFVNESGLYSLVLSNKLPTAKKFKRWHRHELRANSESVDARAARANHEKNSVVVC